MADYQNLFTRVQIIGPAQHGVPLGPATARAPAQPAAMVAAGPAGQCPAGPDLPGQPGHLASLILGTLSINIMGFNMLAQVNWDIIAVRAPAALAGAGAAAPEYGLRLPPLNEGGWWLMAGGLLTVSILLWWLRTYTRARALGWARTWPGPSPRRSGCSWCWASSARC
jgi:photosynthetic reaction center M subunit